MARELISKKGQRGRLSGGKICTGFDSRNSFLDSGSNKEICPLFGLSKTTKAKSIKAVPDAKYYTQQ